MPLPAKMGNARKVLTLAFRPVPQEKTVFRFFRGRSFFVDRVCHSGRNQSPLDHAIVQWHIDNANRGSLFGSSYDFSGVMNPARE